MIRPSPLFQFFVSFFLSISTISINNTVHAYSTKLNDQQTFLSIRTYITGDPSGVLSSWHFCQWKGITCSRKWQRVTSLDLSSQQLDGTLSPPIGNLSFLGAINLNINNFRGYIPPGLDQLFRLQYLTLKPISFNLLFQ